MTSLFQLGIDFVKKKIKIRGRKKLNFVLS